MIKGVILDGGVINGSMIVVRQEHLWCLVAGTDKH